MCLAVCPTSSMSVVRNDFCTDVARGAGGSARPRKYGMNCTMPAVVRSSPVSGGGTSEEEGARMWPRSSKKLVNRFLISAPCTAASLPAAPSRPALGAGRLLAQRGADLGFLLRHGLAPRLEGLPHQVAQVGDGFPRLLGQVRGGYGLGRPAHPSCDQHRGGGAG